MIDLRSDTVTTPDEAMREAAATAEVGDDVYGEDPTVNDLESRAAALLGTEDALFFPSGTMANQAAARTHTERGQEVLCERESHVFKWELGGLAQLSELQVRTVDGGPRGCPDAETVRDGLVDRDHHRAGTGLLTLENTHNSRGGTAIAPSAIADAAEPAREADVPVHLDGARLFNAAVARDVDAAAFVEHVDSVMVSLSKGLGAPVGSVLAGPEAFIERATRTRKLFGGGMRQAGIVAAPGIRALDNVADLAADHERAQLLADGIADAPGLDVSDPETNIVLVGVDDAESFLDACESAGVLGVPFDEGTARFCTHRDVSTADVERAIEAIRTAA